MKLASKRVIGIFIEYILFYQHPKSVSSGPFTAIKPRKLNNVLNLAKYCAKDNMKMENYFIIVHSNGSFNFINITAGLIKCLIFERTKYDMSEILLPSFAIF